MQTVIHFRCSCCGARIRAPAQLIGETRSCPGCGEVVVVPEPEMGGVDVADPAVGGLCPCSIHPAFVCANSAWACQDRDLLAARQPHYGVAS